MGDMADMALEECYRADEMMQQYMAGEFSPQEAECLGITDMGCTDPNVGLGAAFRRARPTPRTCRCCGETGLKWMNVEGKWLLGNGAEVHQCKANPYKGTDHE